MIHITEFRDRLCALPKLQITANADLGGLFLFIKVYISEIKEFHICRSPKQLTVREGFSIRRPRTLNSF
jgi:hypothetical protein